jgi:hypothetical protein
MQRVIAWAADAGMHTLVLHASDAGRPLSPARSVQDPGWHARGNGHDND